VAEVVSVDCERCREESDETSARIHSSSSGVASGQPPLTPVKRNLRRPVPTLPDNSHHDQSMFGYAQRLKLPGAYLRRRARNPARTPDQTPCSDERRYESDNSASAGTQDTSQQIRRQVAEDSLTSAFHPRHSNRVIL